MANNNMFEAARFNMQGDQASATLDFMFPTTDKFKKLQMVGENTKRMVNSLAVTGIFRRKFHSQTLAIFQEELNINNIALDRKGRIEASEISASVRHAKDSDED
jgi:hypothetical protein